MGGHACIHGWKIVNVSFPFPMAHHVVVNSPGGGTSSLLADNMSFYKSKKSANVITPRLHRGRVIGPVCVCVSVTKNSHKRA